MCRGAYAVAQAADHPGLLLLLLHHLEGQAGEELTWKSWHADSWSSCCCSASIVKALPSSNTLRPSSASAHSLLACRGISNGSSANNGGVQQLRRL